MIFTKKVPLAMTVDLADYVAGGGGTAIDMISATTALNGLRATIELSSKEDIAQGLMAMAMAATRDALSQAVSAKWAADHLFRERS